MSQPREAIASTPVPEIRPTWRPTVRAIERLILDGQTPFLMRRYITLSLYKEGSDGGKPNDDSGETQEQAVTERLTSTPRRAVICSFPERTGFTGRRFNLSLEEAAHISSFQQELANLRF